MNRIIINADDFGFSTGVNDAILSLAKSSKISSTTVMVNMPHCYEVREALEIPNFGVGLHLNLTQGRPVCSPDLISSLVDDNGEFYTYRCLKYRLLKGIVRSEDLVAEIEAQYKKLEVIIGERITHIDSHQGIHKNPVLANALIRWKQNIRSKDVIGLRSPRRFYLDSEGIINLSKTPVSLKKRFVIYYTNWLHNRYAKFFILPKGELLALDNKKITTLKILMADSISLNNNFIEVSCHPATSLDGLPKTKLLDKRIKEYEVLKSGSWNSKIKLTNFKNEE